MRRPSSLNNTDSIEMCSIESLIVAEPSAPCEHLLEVARRLSNVQEDRLCGAIPIGQYHEYQPVNTEDDHPFIVRDRIGSSRDNEEFIVNAIENGPSSEPTMTHPKLNSRLFDRQMSADVAPPVRPRPLVYRSSISDSGLSNPHIRLSDHRPSANATNSSAGIASSFWKFE